MAGRESELRPRAAAELGSTACLASQQFCHALLALTNLVGPLILLLLPIRLIQLVLQLSLQVFLSVHDVQIFIVVMIPLIFILTAAADIIKYLPQFIVF